MDYQKLAEIADKELTLGRVDRELMRQALDQANRVPAVARQNYWALRSEQIIEHSRSVGTSEESNLWELSARLGEEGAQRKFRATLVGCAWFVACFAGLTATAIFWYATHAA